MTDRAFEFEAIGTHWQISLPADIHEQTFQQAIVAVKERIETFDRHYSRFREDSLVAEMARTAGEYLLPDDAKPMMDLYWQLYQLTDGAFTPLIGQTLIDAGYDATYSLTPGVVTTPPRWEDVLEYDFPRLTIKQPVWLDFGAAGKGYLIDIIARLLEETLGVSSFCINAGGDILVRSADGQAQRIGLEDPLDITQAIGVATIHEGSICGSAGNRRAWGEWHHTIDPRTLSSPKNPLAIWVTAKTAMLADGLTTCLALIPPAKLEQTFDFQYLLLQTDYSVIASPQFPAELFRS